MDVVAARPTVPSCPSLVSLRQPRGYLPAPIRTFPFPAFHPTNLFSLATLVFTWIHQTLWPPPESSVIYEGTWHLETGSVHVTSLASMMSLWQYGFYGKGNLSRSEPHWLEAQKRRQGGRQVNEQLTAKRREDRQVAKWERAKAQQEAIELIRKQEAEHGKREVALGRNAEEVGSSGRKNDVLEPSVTPEELSRIPNSFLHGNTRSKEDSHCQQLEPRAPTGPMQLLSLPNSNSDDYVAEHDGMPINAPPPPPLAPVGPMELLALPNSEVTDNTANAQSTMSPSTATVIDCTTSLSPAEKLHTSLEAETQPLEGNGIINGPVISRCMDDASSTTSKRRKSVRFSTEIAATVFHSSDPPNATAPAELTSIRFFGDIKDWLISRFSSQPPANQKQTRQDEIENIEHLQLSPEEAFFLAYGLGCLRILDPLTREPMSSEKVLLLFRQYSYFPPRTDIHESLRPDDPFLINYVVYHHFRSMGWCIRPGIKFGVGWLLYHRGPPFSHAEFGLLVIPSYRDVWWRDQRDRLPPQPRWNWLTGIGRTLSQVFKTLVLVYVDVPPPHVFDDALRSQGIWAGLAQFRVQEVIMSRWLQNRNRTIAAGS